MRSSVTGGQLQVRVAPTTDRQKLHAAANRFAPDGGANTLLDTLLEADKRFLKNAADRRAVFVILTTDEGATSVEVRTRVKQITLDQTNLLRLRCLHQESILLPTQ